MLTLPVLETERLVLRRFELDDAEYIHLLLNNPEVAYTLMDINLPYTLDDARSMIIHTHSAVLDGSAYVFAIEHKGMDLVIGYIDIEVEAAHQRGEIAYWLGSNYWRYGYASEAAKRIVQFAIDDLKLNRVYGYCMARNVASARVLMKTGMQYEGTLRQETLKNDVFEDVEFYGLVRPKAATEQA
jgi:[ribosomal protein S5]-alanine N-acetyltransferase